MVNHFLAVQWPQQAAPLQQHRWIQAVLAEKYISLSALILGCLGRRVANLGSEVLGDLTTESEVLPIRVTVATAAVVMAQLGVDAVKIRTQQQ